MHKAKGLASDLVAASINTVTSYTMRVQEFTGDAKREKPVTNRGGAQRTPSWWPCSAGGFSCGGNNSNEPVALGLKHLNK